MAKEESQVDHVTPIIERCLAMDTLASEVYLQLAGASAAAKLQEFWKKMADEECSHIEHWRRILVWAKRGAIPDVFENPTVIERELAVGESKVRELLDSSGSISDVQKAFLIAYRLEFYLLHPAFSKLFRVADVFAEGSNIEEQYDLHVREFVDMISLYGATSPELDLIGNVLQRLWQSNRELTTRHAEDFLTGVLSRRGLYSMMTPFSFLAQRANHQVGIMMIDLDGFKRINDLHGHFAGDRVLETLAEIIKTRIRRSDLVGRFGGDEFLVFLSQVTLDQLRTVGKEICHRCAAADRVPSFTVSIGASHGTIGINVEKDLDQLIDLADRRLYQAKASGRNAVVVD
ncbi:MAG: diguanylate cyclase [Planctomycetaceae bacterium]|nr:diguanylate cyclase [Planctomycetaceae bacterium]